MTFICQDGLHRHCDGLRVDMVGSRIHTARCDCSCHRAEVPAEAEGLRRVLVRS